MSGYLLDTNVISETSKDNPNPAVARFMAEEVDLWLSVIVIGEIEFGVQSLAEGRRRDGLRDWVSRVVSRFEGRTFPVQRREAELAATLMVRSRRNGRALQVADALIAATAMQWGLIVATRDVGDFSGLGVEIVNPWDSP